MNLQGSLAFIICCLLIQFAFLTRKRYLINLSVAPSRIGIFCIQGLVYMVYPLLGHLADVYLTRYRTLKCSFIILIGGGTLLLVCAIVDLICCGVFNSCFFEHQPYNLTAIVLVTGGIICIAGVGLFKANAIQFGLDQLLEAPTQKLIAFIHWYYWSKNVADLALFYFVLSFEISFVASGSAHRMGGPVLFLSLIVMIIASTVVASILFCVCKKHFYIQRAGLNQLKNVYRVLRYAWKHKVPENRSAFTYWEQDIPPRVDLGKDKYGGPFTTEEVEDTKTLLHILPLFLSLFGFHLAGDGYSAPDQFQRTSCPSLPVLILIVYNPLHMNILITVVGIPLYRLVIRKVFPCFRRVLMLTRMWIGLFLSLLQVILYIIVAINRDTTYWQQHHHFPHIRNHTFGFYSPGHWCVYIRTGIINDPHELNKNPIDNTYLWFIIPQFLNGLSSLFVSMTALEFICAQAPRTTQGMLIGLWYATFSIRYLVVGILDTLISEWRSWLICEGVKGFLILVSLVLFTCLSRRYRYRQRDEIVNVQWMIEEIFERRMDQEEEYMQERRALLENRRGCDKT